MRFLIFLIVFLTFSNAGRAASPEVKTYTPATSCRAAPPSGQTQGKLKKELTDSLEKQADSCIIKHEWEEAYHIYTRLLNIYESDSNEKGIARTYYALGNISNALDKEGAAEAFLQKSLAFQFPELTYPNYKNLANIYRKTGRFAEELACYDTLVAFFDSRHIPDSTAIMLNSAGYYYLTHGEYREALACFDKALETQVSDTKLDEILHKGQFTGNIARTHYMWGHYPQALTWHRKAIRVFSSSPGITSNIRINIANQMEGMGLVCIQQGKLDSAVFFLEKSMRIRENAGDILGVGACYDGLGEVQKRTGNFLKALFYLQKADTLIIQFMKGIAVGGFRYNQAAESRSVTYLKMGQLYLAWNKPQLALQALDTAFSLASRIGYEKGKADILLEKGNAYMKMTMLNRAATGYRQALVIFQNLDNRPEINRAMECMGDYYLRSGETEKAFASYKTALRNADLTGMEEPGADLCLKLGHVYSLAGNTDSAYYYLHHGLAMAENAGLVKSRLDIFRELASLYEHSGNADSAGFYYKRVAATQRTFFDREISKTLALLQADYKYRNQERTLEVMTDEKQARERKLKRTRVYSLLGMILLMILGVLTWFYQEQQKLKTRQEALMLEQRLLRSQMNPHFIFNALQAIHNYILIASPEEAGKYLAKFARLMRMILENSRETSIPFARETEFLDHYLKLQKLRFEDKFDYKIVVDPDIMPDIMHVPPMLAQPFIENSILHGVVPKPGKGNILISFSLKKGYILFTIEDDGVGMEEDAGQEREEHTSYAIRITRERLQRFKYPVKFQELIHIEHLFGADGAPSGTRISFPVPLL